MTNVRGYVRRSGRVIPHYRNHRENAMAAADELSAQIRSMSNDPEALDYREYVDMEDERHAKELRELQREMESKKRMR